MIFVGSLYQLIISNRCVVTESRCSKILQNTMSDNLRFIISIQSNITKAMKKISSTRTSTSSIDNLNSNQPTKVLCIRENFGDFKTRRNNITYSVITFSYTPDYLRRITYPFAQMQPQKVRINLTYSTQIVAPQRQEKNVHGHTRRSVLFLHSRVVAATSFFLFLFFSIYRYFDDRFARHFARRKTFPLSACRFSMYQR